MGDLPCPNCGKQNDDVIYIGDGEFVCWNCMCRFDWDGNIEKLEEKK